ncbi:MAG: hypothetical protein ACK4ND_08830 [Cytophagaceae bacterium]
MKYLFSFILCVLYISASAQQEKPYAPNGGPFTPAGDMRILVILAGTEDDCSKDNSDYTNSFWPQENNKQTPCETFFEGIEQLFYSDTSQFRPEASDKSLSNFFYQSSRNNKQRKPFRVTADIFPERINIPGSKPNNRVLFETIQQKYPNYDWSRYDHRKNNPNFLFDNSTSDPDNIIDYIVVIWRKPGLSGYAATSDFTFTTNIKGHPEEFKTHRSSGFTVNGSLFHLPGIKGIFLHELAHSLYNCPHLFAANGVYGDYFYASTGWGFMNYGMIFSTPNAWESWYLGWIDLPENRNITNASQNGTYILRDFMTSGDAMRINIPGTTQYLWLENHTGKSMFDYRDIFTKDAFGEPIPEADKGLFIYIENLTDNRNHIIKSLSTEYANGMKVLHSKGNFDYKILNMEKDKRIWDNWAYDFTKVSPNPSGSHNDISYIRENLGTDYTSDSIIYRNFTNNRCEGCMDCNSCKDSRSNEYATIWKEDGQYTYSWLGTNAAFGNSMFPQKIGFSHNPLITNLRKYDPISGTHEPVILHNLSITIHPIVQNGNVKVEIKYGDVYIEEHQKLTGNLLIPGKSGHNYSMHILPGKMLSIEKSGTPDRHNKGRIINNKFEYPDFVNPSILTLDSQSQLIVDDGARLIIKKGSTLHMKEGSSLTVKGKGKIIIEKDAYICVENGSLLNLGKNGKITIHKRSKEGINPLLKRESKKYLSLEDLKRNFFPQN